MKLILFKIYESSLQFHVICEELSVNRKNCIIHQKIIDHALDIDELESVIDKILLQIGKYGYKIVVDYISERNFCEIIRLDATNKLEGIDAYILKKYPSVTENYSLLKKLLHQDNREKKYLVVFVFKEMQDKIKLFFKKFSSKVYVYSDLVLVEKYLSLHHPIKAKRSCLLVHEENEFYRFLRIKQNHIVDSFTYHKVAEDTVIDKFFQEESKKQEYVYVDSDYEFYLKMNNYWCESNVERMEFCHGLQFLDEKKAYYLF